jgi:branched-chain amino acid transport system ATP-binding protein
MAIVSVHRSHDVGTTEVVLEASNLSAGYGGVAVVRDFHLRLHAGEIVALLGPNGAGKTTTLLALAGELTPLAGEVTWLGVSTTAPLHVRARQGLALVPGDRSVIMALSVRDNLLLGVGGIEPALEMFPELGPLMRRRAGLLSGGEQQILSLARALATEPRALLIDELSLGLAPAVVDRLFSRLREFARQRAVAVLLVEQQYRRALGLADRWLLMRSGSVVADGSSADGLEPFEQAYRSAETDAAG